MRRRGIACGMLLVLTLMGCTPRDDPAESPEDGAASSGEVTEPERPTDERSEAGAIAFAGYVFDVLQFSYGTADPTPLEDIADLELCFGCMQPLETIATAAASGAVLTGDADVSTDGAQVVDDTGARTTVRLRVQLPELSAAAGSQTVPESDAPMLVTLRWDATQWTLVDFAPVGN